MEISVNHTLQLVDGSKDQSFLEPKEYAVIIKPDKYNEQQTATGLQFLIFENLASLVNFSTGLNKIVDAIEDEIEEKNSERIEQWES